MKPKKLNLNDLNVKSFVTTFENEKEETVKGGIGSNLCSIPAFCTLDDWCPTGLGGLCTRADICNG